MEKLLTKQEVANYLQVSVKTVDRMRNYKANKLKSFKSKGTVRFDSKDVEDFKNKNKS